MRSLPALLVLSVLAGCQPAPPVDLAQVDRALAQHRYLDARKALLDLRESEADSLDAVRRLAVLEMELGDGYSAERYLDEWRSASGETPEWVTQRARSLILQGKARLARDLLEQASPSEEEAEQRAWLLVWAAMEEGRIEQAQEQVQAALARHPGSADLHARAGRLMALRGDWEAADRHVAEALAADPQHYEALLLKGEGLIARGDLEGALEPYRLAAKIYPDFAVPPANVAGLLIDLGRLEEAQSVLRPALERHADFALIQFTSARLDAQNKRWKLARATLQAIPAQFKRDVPAVILLEADVEAALGNHATAQALYASIMNKPGMQGVVTERLGQAPPA